ncbi:allantoate amidohydrolase [Saccharothrix sp. ALI-22-I]|uniref:allantoate amidohydrolase n=1 Tax=Saccharothrix sp. ALI-22-I TaxID=1933778 RepID=UPI00097BE327|nr:allantoate amidohydrolase [Saccharothrix sp. ALI-22-I]ONI83653.1 allantoate amidohydrolase [Saccharothrix sp. ALI-22-I]
MTDLADIADVGRDPRRGGYSRHGFDPVERELREWFVEEAERRDLDVYPDRNGNIWAWWGEPGRDAVITGSHLDSVPGGGAFDGPLGVVSALQAVDLLRAQGFRPSKPLAIVVFVEEEGGRFGVACLGSRLMTGAITPEAACKLVDAEGITFGEAAHAAGFDPLRMGRDDRALTSIGAFVELHVEQGRGLDVPIGLASSILAHGRWRYTFTGEGNHAGATLIEDRRDPMLPAAQMVLAARRTATHGARATVGRLVPNPGGTNVIASSVDVWLDARADDEQRTREVVERITTAARAAAAEEGCSVRVTEESWGGTVFFDPSLISHIRSALGENTPTLPTGAGHDAGILAAHVPTAMLFVRNPTGISHAPEEFAEADDCAAGVVALATTLEHLTR